MDRRLEHHRSGPAGRRGRSCARRQCGSARRGAERVGVREFCRRACRAPAPHPEGAAALKTKIELLFKGERSYIQGPDMVNATLREVMAMEVIEELSNLVFVMNRMTARN